MPSPDTPTISLLGHDVAHPGARLHAGDARTLTLASKSSDIAFPSRSRKATTSLGSERRGISLWENASGGYRAAISGNDYEPSHSTSGGNSEMNSMQSSPVKMA